MHNYCTCMWCITFCLYISVWVLVTYVGGVAQILRWRFDHHSRVFLGLSACSMMHRLCMESPAWPVWSYTWGSKFWPFKSMLWLSCMSDLQPISNQLLRSFSHVDKHGKLEQLFIYRSDVPLIVVGSSQWTHACHFMCSEQVTGCTNSSVITSTLRSCQHSDLQIRQYLEQSSLPGGWSCGLIHMYKKRVQ